MKIKNIKKSKIKLEKKDKYILLTSNKNLYENKTERIIIHFLNEK